MTDRNRRLFEAAGDALVLYDPATVLIEDANQSALRCYGYTRHEMIGMSKLNLSAEPEKTAAALAEIRSKDGKRIDLRWHKRKDGTGFPVEIVASAVEIDGRRLILSSVRDISRRLAASEELSASERRLRQIVETLGAVFWMTSTDKTRILYVSPAYEKVWGRTCESLYRAPQSWLEAIVPEDRENVREYALSRQPDGHYDEVYRIRRPDGSLRWIRDRAFQVHDAEGKTVAVAGMAEDVTDQMRAAAATSDPLPPRARGRETVMIIEDDLLVRRFIARTLDGLGYRTIEAADGRDGLTVLEADREKKIRLILADLVTPRLDGAQFGKIVAKVRSDVAVLYMSGCCEDASSRLALRKPFSARELAEAVRRGLDGG